MATGRSAELDIGTMATRKRRAQPSGTGAKRAKPKGTARLARAKPAPEPLAEPPSELSPTETPLEEVEDPAEEPTAGLRPASLARSSDRGLARADPLQLYMQEVSKHALLTREQEYDLAVRYRQTGDLDAAYRLVAANLRLVVKLAHEYHRNPLSLLDLIQEGNIGLMQAVKKYDPGRGVKLSSYAAWWIRAYILRYIMDNWKMVKLGTTEAQRKLFFKLRQEQERLVAQGYEPSPKLLAERLNVSEQDVVEMDQRLGHDEVSLDAPLGEDGKETRADRSLPSTAIPTDEQLGNEELKRIFRQHLAEFAKTLEGKERFIFERRLIADEPLTLQEIGDHYGVSRERARQIEANLIQRIGAYLRERIPDFDLAAVPKN
jgi:RNA polymerase sigma-32 factor